MEKQTNAQASRETSLAVKLVAALFISGGLAAVLTECVRNGLWFVALGVVALTACTAFGALLILLSNRLSKQKSFDITTDTTER